MADLVPFNERRNRSTRQKTSEGRLAFYDRARGALADSLRKADPPLSLAFIEHVALRM